MTGTIFYVHGAGSRDAQAAIYEADLRSGLGLPGDSPKLRRSRWGEQTAPRADLPDLAKVLPEVIPADAGFARVPDLEDPLAPLRALEARQGEAAFSAPPADANQLLALLQAGIVDLSDPEIGLTAGDLQAAAAAVARSPEFNAAAGAAVDVVDATLESVSAVAIRRQAAAGFGVGDVVGAIAKATGAIAERILGSGAMSAIGTWVGASLGPALKLALSRRLAQDREAIMRRVVLVPTDVVFYQRNGAACREFVRGELEAVEAPVVAVGHSLGGILLVDTLFGADARDVGVSHLITFGSQSAFLQSVGALGEVTPSLPWINIWTRYDFVSFLAGAMWPGLVEDVEIPMAIGFPDSHASYYLTDAFIDVLRAQPSVQAILA